MTSTIHRPDVSIVLPTYNRSACTARAIRSVLEQSLDSWELLVVDDGSEENIEQVVRQFSDRRIQYLRHTANRGASAARNTGLDAATAPFVAFIDSDAEWLPQKLERQLLLFDAPDVAIATCAMELVNGNRTETVVPTARGRIYDKVLRRRAGVWDTSTFLVRASVGVRFDETFPAYQDFDYLARISCHHAVDFVEDALVRVHTDTLGPRVSDRNLEGRLRVLEKYKADLQKRPEVLSHHHVRVALKYYHQGNVKAARRHLAQAAAAYPSRLQHWAWLASTAFGRRGLWLALRVFRHETTK